LSDDPVDGRALGDECRGGGDAARWGDLERGAYSSGDNALPVGDKGEDDLGNGAIDCWAGSPTGDCCMGAPKLLSEKLLSSARVSEALPPKASLNEMTFDPLLGPG